MHKVHIGSDDQWQNHGMVWIGNNLRDPWVSTPLPWAGLPSPWPDWSKVMGAVILGLYGFSKKQEDWHQTVLLGKLFSEYILYFIFFLFCLPFNFITCSIIHQTRTLLDSLSNAVIFILFSTEKKRKKEKYVNKYHIY